MSGISRVARTKCFSLFKTLAGLPGTIQVDHGGSSFLDRAPSDIDHGPVIAKTELAGESELLGDRGSINIGRVFIRIQSKKAVLADLTDTFGARDKTDNKRVFQSLQLWGNGNAGNKRYIACFEATIGEVNTGRGF